MIEFFERSVQRMFVGASKAGEGKTKVTIHNTFAASGFGKLIVGFATKAAQKDADAFAGRIKAAVESS